MSAVDSTTGHHAATGDPSLGGLGGILRLGAARVVYETRVYFRSPDSVFFTFLFPFIMLGIFTAAFGSAGNIGTNPDGTGGISVGAYYLPGMLAAGMLLSGVQNLAVDIAGEKGDGTLKRLGGTPLSPLSYFMGKIGEVLVTGAIQAALLILVARFVLGIDLPTEPGKWLTFAWVFLFGVITCAFLGIALSALPRSGKSATAVVIPIVLILQFISGVYLQFYVLPEWMQNVAGLFPLKWMAQGMRGVFLPESFAGLEQSGSWDFPLVALNLGIWLVVGLVLSRVTFRWIRKDS
ncbi:ABC-2 type transport system permease protein [Cryobacterium sp. MP_M5]|uniref:ABC transporter permease n=1 Tax=unclassified Cryobacterium TaxID=2649013 RepID=UPI0018CB8178|nr:MULTISPECIES: ABC transporter permease [unclassified Cryobacterium]MBG6056751.1 ABC-2 type transport system permease protein [Cryobacterium sp. MP_M3]MEC5176423.1 ABC-2 type transport system permease protein [Cryobacterium sp. MP_M5]